MSLVVFDTGPQVLADCRLSDSRFAGSARVDVGGRAMGKRDREISLLMFESHRGQRLYLQNYYNYFEVRQSVYLTEADKGYRRHAFLLMASVAPRVGAGWFGEGVFIISSQI